jgi:predicted house-cleaning noncanonical NTP pyrophosphatase (MazG superfamily)
MTGKADFTPEEWQTVLEAPVSAGMIVVTAQRGGSFRESFAMAKAYAEARQQHGGSPLVDEIVASKPQRDHTHYHSHEELKAAGLQHLQEAVAILGQKAAPEEIAGYRSFVLALAEKVAHAHREDGQEVSPAEQAALDEIRAALGATSA